MTVLCARATTECGISENLASTCRVILATHDRCPHMAVTSPAINKSVDGFVVLDSSCFRHQDGDFTSDECDKESGDWLRLVVQDNRTNGRSIKVHWYVYSESKALLFSIEPGSFSNKVQSKEPLVVLPYYAKTASKSSTGFQELVKVKRPIDGGFRRLPIKVDFRINRRDGRPRVNSTATIGAAIVGAGGSNWRIGVCNILLLAANPSGTSSLKLNVEIREIEDKIRAAEHRELVHFQYKLSVRPDDVIQALNETQPTIVQFSGHGEKWSGILFEDEAGTRVATTGSALSHVLTAMSPAVKVVFLNACYSESLANELLATVDCVICAPESIGDSDAVRFAGAFYRGIGFNKTVRESFEQGDGLLRMTNADSRPVLRERYPGAADQTLVDPSLSRTK